MIDEVTRLRDGVAHRTSQRLEVAGLPVLFTGELKALKTRLYSECRTERACLAAEAEMEVEIARLAAAPKAAQPEDRIEELEQRLDALEKTLQAKRG